MNDLSRREFLEVGVPAGLLALAAVHPALPTEKPPEGEGYITAQWYDRYSKYVGPAWLLVVGRTPPNPAMTCAGTVEGVLFGEQPGKNQWTFRTGPDYHNFEAPDLASAKKVAERHMVEVVRQCLTELEKLAFALRRR